MRKNYELELNKNFEHKVCRLFQRILSCVSFKDFQVVQDVSNVFTLHMFQKSKIVQVVSFISSCILYIDLHRLSDIS